MYDERGRDTNCCTYASDGRLICDADNVHTVNVTYFDDEVRNKRRDSYGEDIWGKTGVVHVVTWYNKKGKVVEQSYFGEGESSVGDNNGVVRFTREYFPDSNIYGRCDEFGVKEKPCLYGNKGVWHRVVMFNRDGNVTNVSNFAANSEPIADSNGMFSWSVTFPSNRVGAVERRDFYGKAIWGNDRLAHVVRYFDNKNRTVEECRFDAQGIPLPDKDGSVRILNEYVGDKKIISRRDEFGLEGGD